MISDEKADFEKIVVYIFSIYTILECSSPLALLANLTDTSLTASNAGNDSIFHSRLHSVAGVGGWLSDSSTDQWIQANFMNEYHVSVVETQGRGQGDLEHWVTEYTLMYGYHELALLPVSDGSGNVAHFSGNYDKQEVVRNTFPPVRAKLVRLVPTAWEGMAVLRWEIYGCIAGIIDLLRICFFI